ncbi:MAG TPA: ATP-binding protein [Burkholderiales bacterium]|nr:ATP-binding protein [Burkholderiales bacterium]
MRWTVGKSSVRHKLFFIVLATTLCAMAISGAAMMMYDLKAFRQAAVNDLDAQAKILGRASAAALAFDDPASAQAYLALLGAKPEIAAAAIYTEKGSLFAVYGPGQGPSEKLPQKPEADGYRIEGNQLHIFKRIVENNEVLGTVYLQSNFDIYEWLKNYFAILGAVMILSALIVLIMSWWLQSAVTRPILSVTAVARSVMEKRDFSLRAKKTTDDEIGYLVEAFNDMLAELGRRAETLESSNQSLAREITERRAAQEAQRNAEKELRDLNAVLEQRVHDRTAELQSANKELESFSYSVSHDLRAPVRSIAGFVAMLKEDHGPHLDGEAHRKLDVIEDATRRMDELIDDLLSFSRLGRQAIKWSELDMGNLAKSVFQNLDGKIVGHPIDFKLGPLPSALGDRTLLEHVWINYLSNAVKFSAKKARSIIEVGGHVSDTENIYYVKDNGAGFDPAYTNKLFGVFERLHSDKEFAGTGVGLALVERIVTRHGGRVWAEAKTGEGATFYFSLPKSRVLQEFTGPLSVGQASRSRHSPALANADETNPYNSPR